MSPGFDLTEHLGERGLTHNISAIGELYASYGWVGVGIGGLAFGLLARHWSQLLETDYGVVGTALYGLGTMALFLGIRSLLELVLMMYPVLCWFALDRLLAKTMLKTGRTRQKRTIVHDLA